MKPMSRNSFLQFAGATAAATGLVLAGCDNDDDGVSTMGTVDLGSGDTGILNYAYLLEQLEAAFYVQVIATPFAGMTAAEKTILTDIRDHELAHRDFFKYALGASAIASVEVNFASIDFTNRASVLGTAKAFEDLGVSAYNGAGKLIENTDYLLLAGKIVSVEARHASAIRDLLNPFSADYAGDDVVTVSQGLDGAKTPAEVLTIAAAYVKTTVKFDKLPS
ncbi:MAG: hypothetical protein DI538_07455 [Azospira oryzae]|nr:MAG: hypothetical protein DI538_07455 [Azospira oryzae]